jgi:hypothetical protein
VKYSILFSTGDLLNVWIALVAKQSGRKDCHGFFFREHVLQLRIASQEAMKKRLKESRVWWAIELARGPVSQILMCMWPKVA